MTKQEKAKILLNVADAYYRRGSAIQYNQLSMDRVVRVTPRRQKFFSPEAATEQSVHFLDCATFVWVVYYEAFGLKMPADLTWQMTEVVKPRVYYRGFTHSETDTERQQIEADIREKLEPGDLMVYARTSGSGHAMLYIGNGRFMHCTYKNQDGDYDYAGLCNRFHDGGSLYIDSIDGLFTKPDDTPASKRSIFRDNVKCFAVLRPLDNVNEPTTNTKLRLANSPDLDFSVLSSVYGGQTASIGDDIVYTVKICSRSSKDRTVSLNFQAPDSASLLEDSVREVTVPAGNSIEVSYRVRINDTESPLLDAPMLTANGFHVAANPILLGKNPSAESVEKLVRSFFAELEAETDVYAAACQAYSVQGISIPDTAAECFDRLFYRFDALNGDVLYRGTQNPQKDMAVYSLFGGAGVITPEMVYDGNCRTVYVSVHDLMPGDLILVSDDSLYLSTHVGFYTGDALYGDFSGNTSREFLRDEEMRRYIDSLLGRYAFVVLRPFLKV